MATGLPKLSGPSPLPEKASSRNLFVLFVCVLLICPSWSKVSVFKKPTLAAPVAKQFKIAERDVQRD